MGLFILKSNNSIYGSLTEVRSDAIKHAIRHNKSKEHIDVIKNIMGNEVSKPLGYVQIKRVQGKVHYLWVSGASSHWRVLDRFGRVVRKPTKTDREFWGF